MKEATEHVPFQLPNKFTKVGVLLAGITSSDAGLQVAMANTRAMLIWHQSQARGTNLSWLPLTSNPFALS
eukprot:6582625-Ditylum_brightwellii.AAC.1